jgi:Tektin family
VSVAVLIFLLSCVQFNFSLACSNSTVAEWTRETAKNIELCKQEIKCAMSLRSYVEILFKQVVEDISDQFNRTNESFRTRMEEIRYTKMKLEGLHCGTANQVSLFIYKIELEVQFIVQLCEIKINISMFLTPS